MVSFQYFMWLLEEVAGQPYFRVAVVLYLHLTLLIHEVGHAVVGALLGLKSTGIRLGTRPILKIPLPGYPISVGLVPGSGHTTFELEDNFPETWQVLVTFLAGPLLVSCAGVVFFLMLRHTEIYTAAIFGALMVFHGFYDLRESCPDGVEVRRLWRVLRERQLKEAR